MNTHLSHNKSNTMSADNGSIQSDDLTSGTQHDNDLSSVDREQVDLIDLELITVEPPVEFMHDLGPSTNPRSRPLATHTSELEHGLSKSESATYIIMLIRPFYEQFFMYCCVLFVLTYLNANYETSASQ